MQPLRRPASYQYLLALPEDVRAEILDGEIVVSPSPLPRHSKTQGSLRTFIGKPFDDDDGHGGPGGWWNLLEVDIELGAHDVVRPDLSGWRRARLPNPWDTRPLTVAPDWICEILSPSNEPHDRVKKKNLYARAGVPFYWIVDPVARLLEAYRLENGHWVDVGSYDHTGLARIAPFEAVELELERLFAPPPA